MLVQIGDIRVAHIRFRLVEEGDAEFIYSLRSHPIKSRYLSPVSGDVDEQRTWIRNYKLREQAGDEFYFLIEDPAAGRVGVVRIYDFQGNSFSWGSWLLKEGAPVYVAIESALAVYELGFYSLGMKRSHFEVRKGNARVAKFHERFGAIRVSEDCLNYYYEISCGTYERAKLRYGKYFKEGLKSARK